MKKALFSLLVIVLLTSSIILVSCDDSNDGEHIHTPGAWIIVKEPCCIDGEQCQFCTSCGTIIASLPVAATGVHQEAIIEAVPATCTSTGLTEGKYCMACGKVFLLQTETPKISHVYDNDNDETCNSCGFIRDISCKHTDVTVLAAKTATCIEAGLTEGKICTDCEEVLQEQDVIDALGHTEVIDVATNANCTEDGLTEGKHCSVCNEIIIAQTVIPATGHTEVIDAAKAATCLETGLTEGKHCSVCSTVLVAQTVVDKIDHTVSFGEMLDYYVSIKDTDAGNSLVNGATKDELLGHYDGLMYFKGEMDAYVTAAEFKQFTIDNAGGEIPAIVPINSLCKDMFQKTEQKDFDGVKKAKLIDLLKTTRKLNAIDTFSSLETLRELMDRFIYVYDQINAPCSHEEFLERIDELVNLLAEDRLEPDYEPFEVGADDPDKQAAAKNLYVMYYNEKCPLDHTDMID